MSLIDYSLKDCQCGRAVELERWEDSPGHFATFVECKCGIHLAMRTSKKEDKLAAETIKMWNKRLKRRLMKTGIKSCFCGSKNVAVHKYSSPDNYSVICSECFRGTDELMDKGLLNEEEAIAIWNNEI